MEKQELIVLAQAKARKYGLEEALICAMIEQESGWDTFAVRYEPSFLRKYVGPLYVKGGMTATEAYTRSMSWGLLQIMGEAAREQMFEGPFLSQLCDADTGLEYGCKLFSSMLGREKNDMDLALLRWNGGGNPNYVAEVKARIATYQLKENATP